MCLNHIVRSTILLLIIGAGFRIQAGMPWQWLSRGPGGGGAFFGPSISPYNPDELYVSSDMGEVFHSSDYGASWRTIHFRTLRGGNQYSWMQFTADPGIRYALNAGTPSRSGDSGATWISIPQDPWSTSAYTLHADPDRTDRLLISDYSTLYFSSNSGASYAACFSAGDLLVAGAFFDGQSIFAGTQAGLVASTNGGKTFGLAVAGGIPAAEAMVTFAGAKAGGLTRLFCVTLGSGDVYPGVTGADHGYYQSVYRLDYGVDASWQPAISGIAAGDHPFFVSMCRTNVNIAWLAGGSEDGVPIVYRTTNGGIAWQKVFFAADNENIATGWSGDDPGPWNWRKWSFGENALGFQVCPSDPARAIVTDYGFIHVTADAGSSWRQAYGHASDQNPAHSPTDKTKSYHGIGIEDTSCWHLTWADSNHLFACFTDLRGLLSTNGGRSWTFPPTLARNSTYCAVRHPSGALYAADSTVHDLYAWDAYCQDSRIDGGNGNVILSTNKGVSWQTLHNFGRPVVFVALDPGHSNYLYACMVHSASGGLYRTTNLQAGAGAVWTRLASPPRTQGHPYILRVLNDGALVCSYSARISGDFTDSSGVFVSTNGGASWLDRSDAGMRYYTKDVVLAPHDPSQRVWYAGVWGEWGNSAGLGGLYKTTNRGLAWTRITTNLQSVESCTVHPSNPNEMWVATEYDGLWFSTNLNSVQPQFSPASAYPFTFPTRVFVNPFDSNEVWATSFGNGMRLGRMVESQPLLGAPAVEGTNGLQFGIAAEAGQTLLMRSSTNLEAWTDLSRQTVLEDSILFRDAAAPQSARKFYGAVVVPDVE